MRTLQAATLIRSLDRAAIAPLLCPHRRELATVDVPFLIISRVLAGAAFAAAVPAALVYIGDTVPIKLRPAALADLATGIAAGFALGTLGTAVVSDHLSWRFAFVIRGSAAVILAVLVGRLPEPERDITPGRLSRILNWPGILAPFRSWRSGS